MRLLPVAAAVLSLVAPLAAHLPEVQERRLGNGLRVLAVARPGSGAVHALWAVRGGAADTGALPPVAAEALAQCLFNPAGPGDLGRLEGLEDLLRAEEGAFEALRLARLRRAGPEAEAREQEALRVHHVNTRARLEAALGDAPAVASAGWAEADLLGGGVDLAPGALQTWLRTEAERFRRLTLSGYPGVRDRLLASVEGPGGAQRRAMDALLTAALPGEAYGRVAAAPREALEGLGWSALRTWARRLVVPERLHLVLVGDLDLEALVPVLEATLGSLPEVRGATGSERSTGIPEPVGARRLQASLAVEPQLAAAWRIPSGSHPDHPALELLAQALATRLKERFQAPERPLASEVEVACGLPGLRDPGLFLIRLRPAPGQGLAALEEALRSEQVRLQREAFPEEALRRAQRQLEAAQLQVQEGASALAVALARAQVQQGDWRRAFRFRTLGRDLGAPEIQAVVRTYLLPERATTVLLEPDPLLAPQDPLEARLLEVLRKLVQRQVSDPAQADGIVREALRQLRMLTLAEREQTLKLLQGQVKP